MTKTKRQLRAEAVERLKNCAGARFDAESIVIALTSGRRGHSDWSLECDKLIYLLTDDANDDSTPENGVSDPDGGSNVAYIAPNQPISQSDAPKPAENAENDATKSDIRDFDDSREKLEADVRNHIAISITPNKHDDGALAPVGTVIGWLDRQEAITEQECLVQSVQGADALLEIECAELREENEALREWKACYERMRDERDELVKQRNSAESNAKTQRNNYEQVSSARLHWQKKAQKAEAERDEYREKLSRALDLAHEIGRLQP